MDAFYAHCSTTDDLARQSHQLRRQEYEMYRRYLPSESDDVEIAAARVARATGTSDTRVTNIFLSLYRLDELPHLRALHERMFHLDVHRILAIDRALVAVDDEEVLATVDAVLVDFLTPSRPNQIMPSAARIRSKIMDVIRTEEDSAPSEDSVTFNYIDDTKGAFNALLQPAQMRAVEERIRTVAKQEKLTLPEAFVRAVLGTKETHIVVHTYKALDIPDAPQWVSGVGWLSGHLEGKFTDIDAVAQKVTASYTPTEPMKRFVEGRDGTCRWPGCGVPAHRAQKDHRIEWAEGGPTAPSNLVSLCQHHHNIKTDRRARYIMDPVTAEIVWLMEDGTWVMDKPTGPLAPNQRRWLQTFAQRRKSRRDRATRV